MSSLQYHSNELYFGGKSLVNFKDTPQYVYDLDGIRKRLAIFRSALASNSKIHYAIKANSNLEVLSLFQKEGTGIDVVSGGEIQRAISAGFFPNQIIFSGVAKTVSEIELAIDLGISQINVESPQELERIGKIANYRKKKTSVAFRINPDVDPHTHPYITTGFRENKFGMEEKMIPGLLKLVQANPYLELKGLTMHIGSQIKDLQPFSEAIDKMQALFLSIRSQGFSIESLDIGGGLGINYENPMSYTDTELLIQNYGKMLQKIKIPNCQILCEPGRILVANFGVLLAEIQYVKETSHKNFLILNTGMHHLIRPTLYQAYHHVLPLKLDPKRKEKTYDLVGPICESSDVLAKNRKLQESFSGELLAIADVGAYGFTMSSRYNEHELAKEICI